MNKDTITIIGAGLAGSLLSIFLAKRGFKVNIFEKRPDMRKATVEAGRSINLALSHRGIKALEKLGIAEKILSKAIPMKGRLLHNISGELKFVPYGKDDSEYINSISRSGLNIDLIDIAEEYENVNFYFNHTCQNIDFDKNEVIFENSSENKIETYSFERLLATDGAGSILRQTFEKDNAYQSTTDFLDHGYKELTIPAMRGMGAEESGNGKRKLDPSPLTPHSSKYAIEKNALHIWPRGNYMLIALPNLDGSFTCTLFFPNKGENSFESLDDPEKIQIFFQEQFSDVVPYLPNLVKEFQENPVGLLGTVKCFPWSYEDKALLIGDSAHAIVPFYGQGMNASFEDCLVFDECLEKYEGNWVKIFAEYEKLRKVNTDAIADLAIENFYEMRDGVAEPAFLRKRALEYILENTYSDYHSKYALVTFCLEVPYAIAREKGNQQNEILLELCRQIEDINELDIEEVYQTLKEKVK